MDETSERDALITEHISYLTEEIIYLEMALTRAKRMKAKLLFDIFRANATPLTHQYIVDRRHYKVGSLPIEWAIAKVGAGAEWSQLYIWWKNGCVTYQDIRHKLNTHYFINEYDDPFDGDWLVSNNIRFQYPSEWPNDQPEQINDGKFWPHLHDKINGQQ